MAIGKDGSPYALKVLLKKVPKERKDTINSTIRLTKTIDTLTKTIDTLTRNVRMPGQITKESIPAIPL